MPGSAKFVLLLGTACLLAACDGAVETAEPVASKVLTVKAELVDFAPTLALTGEIQARSARQLSFNTGGRIVERLVDTGDAVEEGQVLARLDPVQQQAAFDAAEAGLAAATAQFDQERSNHDRQRVLFEAGNSTRAVFDAAVQALRISEAAMASAEAQLAAAREQLDDTRLVAPATGLIISRSAEIGQIVQAAQPLFGFAENGPRDAVFDVQEAALLKIPETLTITLETTSNGRETLTGSLRELSPSLDPQTGTVRARVGIDGPAEHLPLGATIIGKASIPAAPAMIIPAGALTVLDGQPAVWLVDPETSRLRVQTVAIALYQEDRIVIEAGILPGSLVVVSGPRAMRVGQEVGIVEESSR